MKVDNSYHAQEINRRAEATGIGVKPLSIKMGLGQNGLRDIITGKSKHPRMDTLQRIADFFGCTVRDLTNEARSSSRHDVDLMNPIEPLTFGMLPLNVPVRGTAVGGDHGDFRFNGSVTDWARRPPGIAHLADAWCIFVQNDSMAMWRSPGELVYAHPTRPARIGDHVIVEMVEDEDGSPGDALLKKLVKRTATKLVLAQYNPPRDDIEIDIRRVKQVWRVFEWSELLGI